MKFKWNHRYIYIVALAAFLLTTATIFITPLPNQQESTGQVAGASTKTFTPTVNTSYLDNPGIGWQHAPGIGTQLLPETVEYPNRSDISWKVIHTAENTYNWKVLDDKINAAKAKGNQIGFRVYSMRGEDYGGHQVPQWALSKGVPIESNGEPNYDSCVYQEVWSKFVEALRAKYDGNSDIAFIDVSGYGDFNEWSYLDRTQWDDVWSSAYSKGTASPTTMDQLDSKTRRRLADMFIGGAITSHQCKNASGQVVNVSYSYPGFQKTQLVMPYAGVRQTTQYVYLRRKDVGFRHDCLARSETTEFMNKVGNEIRGLWKQAPIIYEFCAYDVQLSRSDPLLKASHASLVHDNLEGSNRQKTTIESFMKNVGYRYVLKSITYDSQIAAGVQSPVSMVWNNVGYAPNYPKMGQDFALQLYLTNSNNQVVATIPVTGTGSDISKWLPPDTLPGTPANNTVSLNYAVPASTANGTYKLKAGILDKRTNKNIKLAINGGDTNNRYEIGDVVVGGGGTGPSAVCGNNVVETGELCDDGNTNNGDLCSNDCLHKCNERMKWDGSQCVSADTRPVACAADFNKNGTVDIEDFGQFAQIYKQTDACK